MIQSDQAHNQGQQTELGPKKLTQYVHRAWTFHSGLPGTVIQAISQTSDGFLWLGTDGGLARFDGLNFLVFDQTNTPAMTNESIHILVVGPDNSLWIGTEDGLLRLKDGIFSRYTEKDGLSGNNIVALSIDGNGNLLVYPSVPFGKGHLSRWNNGRFIAEPQDSHFFLTSHNRQCFGQSMLKDHNGDIWEASFPVRGLSMSQNGKKTRYSTEDGLSSNAVMLLFEDERGTIWIKTDKAVDRFMNGKFLQYHLRPGESEPYVTCVREDKRGGLWFQTMKDGIFLWNRQGISHFSTKEGLSSDWVRSIFEDREGNHWIVTKKGLDLLQEGFFIPYGETEGITDESSLNLMEALDGSIWVGTLHGRLYRLSDDKVTEFHGLALAPSVARPGEGYISHAILSIYQTSNGQMWAGNVAGLAVIKNGSPTALPGASQSISGPVETMYEDSQHAFWIGTERGLIRLKNGEYTRFSTEPGGAINAVSVITGSGDGGLWIGTSGGGVRHFKDGVFHDYTMADGLSSALITALLESSDGTLWIGTPRGLNSLKGNKFTSYTSGPTHALQNHICAILEDSDRRLWLSSTKGIIRVSIQELEDFAAGKSNFGNYATYGVEDGIRSTACRQGTQPTGIKDHLGNLWFATDSGITGVDPIKVSKGMSPLHVFIDNISADLIPVDPIRGGSVPPGKNDLEFHYGAVNFREPTKIQFRYRLVGLNPGWVNANSRSAYYTNLPPGRYQFQVQVKNMDGTWNEAGSSVEIRLMPKFYQTLWFCIFCLATLALALTALYFARKRQFALQMQQRLEERLADRTRIAQELHDTFLQDIVGLIFNIELASNESLSRPVDAKARLHGVLDQLRQTVAAGRRALTDLRSPSISYGDLANSLQRLGEQLRSETGPSLEVNLEGNISWLPPLIGDEVFQISREALFNAIRHAAANAIHVNLTCSERELALRVADDGCGIEPEVLRRGRAGHFGLLGMKERAERIGAQFTCDSSPGSGTEIVVRVALPAFSDKHDFWRFMHSFVNWFVRRKIKKST